MQYASDCWMLTLNCWQMAGKYSHTSGGGGHCRLLRVSFAIRMKWRTESTRCVAHSAPILRHSAATVGLFPATAEGIPFPKPINDPMSDVTAEICAQTATTRRFEGLRR